MSSGRRITVECYDWHAPVIGRCQRKSPYELIVQRFGLMSNRISFGMFVVALDK